jgi:NAD(P)H-hydrate epimerase
VLKDARTVTGIPYRQTYLNLSGNHGMATAGSGDVLSGIIGSLMAQGLSGETAAPLGVCLHGCAGDIMRRETGTYGLMASDLITGVRKIFAEFEER